MSIYNQLRLRIHEILTYAVNQRGFDTNFDRRYRYTEEMGMSAKAALSVPGMSAKAALSVPGMSAFTKYGSIDLTFYFGDIDLHISTDKSPVFFLRGESFGTYPIERVRPCPTPADPNSLITDDGVILHMTVTEYEQYLERLLEELSGDRCFEWIDRVEGVEEI